MTQLKNLMDEVAAEWAITPVSYPATANMSPEDVFDFGVRHSALHLAKSVAKIAKYAEARDHGNAGDLAEVKETTVKMFLTVIRLAHLQGVSAEEIMALSPALIYETANKAKV